VRLSNDTPRRWFGEIARVHVREIRHGVLSLLGESFLATLYRELAVAPQTGVWIATEQGQVIGFIAGSADVRRSFRTVLRRAWLPLLRSTSGAVFNPSVFRKAVPLLLYPFRSPATTGHAITGCDSVTAELLAIAISPQAQRRGVGRALVHAFEHAIQSWGAGGYYRVATNHADPGSNAFYCNLGFLPCHRVAHHALMLQVFHKSIDESLNPSQLTRSPNPNPKIDQAARRCSSRV
jgi:ribosomal protein S18 acetylase RimI-like enzyme